MGWRASRCQYLSSHHLQRMIELCRCSWLWSSELAEGLLSASSGENGDVEFRVLCRDWHPVEGPHEARQCG